MLLAVALLIAVTIGFTIAVATLASLRTFVPASAVPSLFSVVVLVHGLIPVLLEANVSFCEGTLAEFDGNGWENPILDDFTQVLAFGVPDFLNLDCPWNVNTIEILHILSQLFGDLECFSNFVVCGLDSDKLMLSKKLLGIFGIVFNGISFNNHPV